MLVVVYNTVLVIQLEVNFNQLFIYTDIQNRVCLETSCRKTKWSKTIVKIQVYTLTSFVNVAHSINTV